MTIKELEKEIREKTTVLDKDELKKAASFKLQAPSLTVTEGYYRIQLKRRIYEVRKTKKENNRLVR